MKNIMKLPVGSNILYKICHVSFFVLLFITVSCRKLVDVPPPVTKLVGSTVYSSNATATAVLTGIYERMISGNGLISSGTGSLSFSAGLSADELKLYVTSGPIIYNQLYQDNLSSSNFTLFWGELY